MLTKEEKEFLRDGAKKIFKEMKLAHPNEDNMKIVDAVVDGWVRAGHALPGREAESDEIKEALDIIRLALVD